MCYMFIKKENFTSPLFSINFLVSRKILNKYNNKNLKNIQILLKKIVLKIYKWKTNSFA